MESKDIKRILWEEPYEINERIISSNKIESVFRFPREISFRENNYKELKISVQREREGLPKIKIFCMNENGWKQLNEINSKRGDLSEAYESYVTFLRGKYISQHFKN